MFVIGCDVPSAQRWVTAARPVARRAAQVLRRDERGDLPLSVKRLSLASECRLEHVDHHRCHAAAAQEILARQVLGLVKHWVEARGMRRLACACGVFLNVKLNQRIGYEAGLQEHWIVPDAGDSGLAVGRRCMRGTPEPRGGRGRSSTSRSAGLWRRRGPEGARSPALGYHRSADPRGEAARLLADGKIVGWFQGRMEAGPRALGNRSILMVRSPPRTRPCSTRE